MTTITNTEAETIDEGARLGQKLTAGAVVALFGELGAGKTTFTRGISKGLGIAANVQSPTFTLVNEYPGPIPLFHFDMYRLQSENELFDIGWDEYLEQGGICVVEWSEKALGAFPPEAIYIEIKDLGNGRRSIEASNKENS